jgi:hypothetical protein
VDQIRNCVLEQIRLATLGVESHVETLQTNTGVKDKIAQHWIDILIKESRRLQAMQPSKCLNEISSELLEWLKTQTDQPYNPLLDMMCQFILSTLCFMLIFNL